MDGKLNLNAHSHRWHADNEFRSDQTEVFVFDENNNTTLSTFTGNATDNTKPAMALGQGYGPPEINLRTIVADNDEFLRLMYGDAANGIWGRNGQDFGHVTPRPGIVFADATDQNTFLRFGNVSQGLPIFDGAYGSHPDVHGRFANGVSANGLPVFGLTNLTNEIHENEYERSLMNLSQYGYSGLTTSNGNTANFQTDAPFSYAEIERILRGNDNDAKLLPNRIADLAPNTFNALNTIANRARTGFNRMNIGGHSFDMPVTPTDFVAELRRHLQASGGLTAAQIDEQLEEMLPPELFMGLKFDINRPFGDGLDGNRANDANDNDVVPDNHWGLWSEDLVANPALLEQINEANLNETDANSNPIDLDNDGLVGNADDDEHLVRYRLAKNLYVMMRTILRTSDVDTDQADIERILGDGTTDPQNVNDLNADGNIDGDDLAIFVAQWAINVVDFRDKDSIMTPFEFDLNPFDGWNVDGNPLVNEANSFVVFGTERPNLLLTETFAYHDRRTEDLDSDADTMATTTDMPDPDDDRDSRLKPQGSMFVELYNPNGVTTARTDDVYETWANDTATNVGIDLRDLSVTNGVSDETGAIATKASPVWRMVVTPTDQDLDLGRTLTANNPRDNIERAIYFVSEDDYTKAELQYDLPARVLQRNGMFLLSGDVHSALSAITGNSSAVIGSGGFAIDGSTTSFINPVGRRTDVTDENVNVNYLNTRSILINAGSSNDALIVRDMAANGSTVNYQKLTLGIPFANLNLSEPIGGYLLNGNTRALRVTTDTDGTQYDETAFVDAATMPYVFDTPLDEGGRTPSTLVGAPNFPSDNSTVSSYRFLHLQRLANPLAGWHPVTNPYLTVDTMPIDLTVFDGTSPGSLPDANTRFATKERGEASGTRRNLWSIEPTRNQVVTAAPTNDNHVFSRYIEDPTTANVEEESLGRTKFGAADQINHVFDFVNNTNYVSTPTFPSLPWNNRPFVSQYELMLVPHSRSSRLLYDYNDVFRNMNYGNDATSFNSSFGYVLNFHQSSLNVAVDKGADFHRIFDYTHVPSKFSDTEVGLDVATFGTQTAPDLFMDADEFGGGDSASVEDNNDPGFRSPFNLLSKFREPGKINVNTVFSSRVWDGVQGGETGFGGHQGIPFNNLVDSRRGGGTGGGILNSQNNNSYFSAPIRGGHAGNLAPGATRNPIDMGLLRSDGMNQELIDSANATVNVNRHPYLKFLTRARMANLSTTRSNVYAVWITVGYFEYDEQNDEIGAELGSESGQIERHRAFYMIDRSIPVGFEPGKNHNVDKTIMLRRYIE